MQMSLTMLRQGNSVIIISDDESDLTDQANGKHRTQPILLDDDDDDDEEEESDIKPILKKASCSTQASPQPQNGKTEVVTMTVPVTTTNVAVYSPSPAPTLGTASSATITTKLSKFSLAAFSAQAPPTVASTASSQEHIVKKPKRSSSPMTTTSELLTSRSTSPVSVTSVERQSDTMQETNTQLALKIVREETRRLLSREMDSMDTNTSSDLVLSGTPTFLGLDFDSIDFINSQEIQDIVYTVKDSDWSFIADLDTEENSKAEWEPSAAALPLPNDTTFPKDMDFIEMFTRLDHYQQSMNQFVNELLPTSKDDIVDSLEPHILSQTNIVSKRLARRSRKRNATIHHSMLAPSASQEASTLAALNATTMNDKDKTSGIRLALIQRLETPYVSGMPRPYVPGAVWQDSNWEDWAQFLPGDLIHVSFTEREDEVLCARLNKVLEKKHRSAAVSTLLNSEDTWMKISLSLPGRQPEDCRHRYLDIKAGTHPQLYRKPLVVSREKRLDLHSTNYHNLISARSVSGSVSSTRYRCAIWENLSNETTIGEGSGDCLALVIGRDIKSNTGAQVVAGSLCDEELIYNIEGNLRGWRSSTGEISQMKGHFTVSAANPQGPSQVLWRTVHDVKFSNNKKLLFSASRDENAKVWNAESKKLLSTLTYHNGPVHQIAVKQNDDNLIATASHDGYGVVWNIGPKGREGNGTVCETTVIPDVEKCSAECLEFGSGPSEAMLFIGYRSEYPERPGWITAFDVQTCDPIWDIKGINGSVGCLAISHHGRYILSGNDGLVSGDQKMHLHDTITGKAVLTANTGHVDVNCVIFSHCDNYIASGSVANQISVFDIRKHTSPVCEFAHDNVSQTLDRYIAPDSGLGIAGMHWMRNNRILVTGGGDCKVKLWDIYSGTGLIKSYQTSNPVNCLAVNEELYTIGAGVSGAQGVVHIWQP